MYKINVTSTQGKKNTKIYLPLNVRITEFYFLISFSVYSKTSTYYFIFIKPTFKPL